jgi:hypothetical protein
MQAFYRSLLGLYPAGYRRVYQREMLSVLAELSEEAAEQDWPVRLWLAARESAGLLRGALEEHFRALTGSDPRDVVPNRRISMRSEFRFPKTTVALMTIILVAVIVAIEKAKALSESIPPSSVPVGPIHPEYVGVVPAFLIAVGGSCVMGLLGWAVVFSLRRSGIHRFSSMQTDTSQSKSTTLGLK